jgi:hypothetical protein
MAEMRSPFHFKGKIGNFRYYFNKAAKKWVVSGNGGASKELIMNNPAFVHTRENMSEFSVLNKAASYLRKALLDLDHLNAGYYFSFIVKVLRIIQKKDFSGTLGRRNIFMSKHKELLPDINFNVDHPFWQVLTRHIAVAADPERNCIAINIPNLTSYYEVNWPTPFSWYRITLVIGQQPDFIWDEAFGLYVPAYPLIHDNSIAVRSEWMKRSKTGVDIELSASFREGKEPPEDVTVLVAVGIELATNMVGNSYSASPGNGTMALVACL